MRGGSRGVRGVLGSVSRRVPVLTLFLGGLVGCASPLRKPVEVRVAVPPVADRPLGAPAHWPERAPSLHARSAILIDARTGRTLFQKNADTPMPVASTQKLVTALVVLESGPLDTIVRVHREDTRVEPTRLGLRTGEQYSRRTLLAGLIVKSGNDVAETLARDVSGDTASFAEAMNRKAADLGATHSHFVNPHGLPASQYSTARDMARIAYHAYREPVLRALMSTKNYPFTFNSGRTRILENTNKLLGRYTPVNGMKTGYIAASGRCLVASASEGGRDLILVQLGSKTQWIFSDAEQVFRWAFAGMP